MNKLSTKTEYWVDGPGFKNYKVLAFNIWEACAKAIRENKPQSLGVAIHAWGGDVLREDYILYGVKHLIENYNLGNNYIDNDKKEVKAQIKSPWYKRIFP